MKKTKVKSCKKCPFVGYNGNNGAEFCTKQKSPKKCEILERLYELGE